MAHNQKALQHCEWPMQGVNLLMQAIGNTLHKF